MCQGVLGGLGMLVELALSDAVSNFKEMIDIMNWSWDADVCSFSCMMRRCLKEFSLK